MCVCCISVVPDRLFDSRFSAGFSSIRKFSCNFVQTLAIFAAILNGFRRHRLPSFATEAVMKLFHGYLHSFVVPVTKMRILAKKMSF